MPSRRDQLQSHQFLIQRVISAIVMRETDPAQAPLRQGIGAVFAGVMVAVMVAAGFGVYGLLTKTGGAGWRTEGAIVIEKDTGAPYVFQGGRLHPMLNYTSALLATGTPGHPVFREPAGALADTPRGVLLGIPYAPESIPAPGQLANGAWTLCSQTAGSQAGPVTSRTVLAMAAAPSDGQPLGDHALLARDGDAGPTYLIWHGARFQVDTSLLSGLFGVVTPDPAGTAWLNAIPRGPDIAPLVIPRSGARSTAAPKYRIGQLLESPVGSGGKQFWMVFDDGLAPMTELQKDIAISQGASEPEPITVPRTNALPRSGQLKSGDQAALPEQPPVLAKLGGDHPQVCATFPADGAASSPNTSSPNPSSSGGAPSVTLGGTLVGHSATPTRSHTATGAVLADEVGMPAGRAELVRVPAAGYFLITDLGIRYAIASNDVLALLGYSPALATDVPDSLIRLIPAGPALDPAAAAAPAPPA